MRHLLAICIIGAFSAGCTNTQKGAAWGTGIGAATGAVIGHQSGNRDKGALIGAAVGGLGGAAVGHQKDKQKVCDKCNKTFKAGTKFCPKDGSELHWKN